MDVFGETIEDPAARGGVKEEIYWGVDYLVDHAFEESVGNVSTVDAKGGYSDRDTEEVTNVAYEVGPKVVSEYVPLFFDLTHPKSRKFSLKHPDIIPHENHGENDC